MAEKTFRSPGVFEREIELKQGPVQPFGTPGTVVGACEQGPAFVPITLSSWTEFVGTFGDLDTDYYAPYAMKEFLRSARAGVFVRVLGGGSAAANSNGTVTDAGFHLSGGYNANPDVFRNGEWVQFLAAEHRDNNSSEWIGQASGSSGNRLASLVRAVIFTSASKVGISAVGTNVPSYGEVLTNASKKFILHLTSTYGSVTSISLVTASLNPSDSDYISKVLNTDPKLFASQGHLLYADFAVDVERAGVEASHPVAILSGSDTGAIAWYSKFGDYRSRYTTAKTPYVISQRFGTKKYDLFYTEAITDGEWPNENIKISIANIRRPTSDTELYGTFNLLVRKFDDTDSEPVILEQFTNLDLNPDSENYIVRRVGDKKVWFNWDQSDDAERRLIVDGDFPNNSRYIRVLPSSDLKEGKVDADALPWGFKGYPLLRTKSRMFGNGANNTSNACLPPIPMRVNVAKKSDVKKSFDSKLYWGVHFERVSGSAEAQWSGLDDGYMNACLKHNNGVNAFTKFMGINNAAFDVLFTGSSVTDSVATHGAWYNEFSLEKVDTFGKSAKLSDAKDWIYSGSYTGVGTAFLPNSTYLNKFSAIARFSLFLQGGFDGTDMLDDVSRYLRNDDVKPNEYTARGVKHGSSLNCNTVKSFRTAIDIVANPENVDTNVLTIPGMRDAFITDYATDACEDRFDTIYIMDIDNVDTNSDVIYTNPADQTGAGTGKPSVETTISTLETRALDSNMAATYWPDVKIFDDANNKIVTVPPSVVVLGAYAFNDKVAQPWFAPAGFNRGGLANVKSADVRLSFSDRDSLYEANINPIAQFPKEGVVILGQKTLQAAQSALDRVNVRRLLLEARRAVKAVAQTMLFEPNKASTWTRFKAMVIPILERIQAQSGLERFKVEIDETTTSPADVENYVMRGKIYLQPTKVAEFISLDFVITNAGVEFA